jgi:hypothetical protein
MDARFRSDTRAFHDVDLPVRTDVERAAFGLEYVDELRRGVRFDGIVQGNARQRGRKLAVAQAEAVF